MSRSMCRVHAESCGCTYVLADAHSYVACVGQDSLVVMSSRFDAKLLEFSTASDVPSQVVWCGEVCCPRPSVTLFLVVWCCDPPDCPFSLLFVDRPTLQDAVVMSWHGRGLLAVGPFGNWVKYVYDDEPVVLAPEHDCVRVFTDERQEILQSVPKDTALIRAIGSDAPAAMLFDAMENFDNGDAKGLCRVPGECEPPPAP